MSYVLAKSADIIWNIIWNIILTITLLAVVRGISSMSWKAV